MQSLADGLPPEVARQIHPEWRKNEAGYWAVRDALLPSYRGRWVAFADGAVIASGDSPVDVFHKGQRTGQHPFITCVGREHEPSQMRRAAFPYDSNYTGEALPLVSAEFRREIALPGVVWDRVIPDTGADASAVPWMDCQQLQLDASQGTPGLMGGVGQSVAPTIVFAVWVYLDSASYRCRLQADFSGHERILGRDVLNRISVLFNGPVGEVVLNP
ncbi:MAG TPA: DUF5678 domain-containing protein [Phycisphaerae bacterium]|jgi:hypothetical protein